MGADRRLRRAGHRCQRHRRSRHVPELLDHAVARARQQRQRHPRQGCELDHVRRRPRREGHRHEPRRPGQHDAAERVDDAANRGVFLACAAGNSNTSSTRAPLPARTPTAVRRLHDEHRRALVVLQLRRLGRGGRRAGWSFRRSPPPRSPGARTGTSAPRDRARRAPCSGPSKSRRRARRTCSRLLHRSLRPLGPPSKRALQVCRTPTPRSPNDTVHAGEWRLRVRGSVRIDTSHTNGESHVDTGRTRRLGHD